MSKHHVRSQTFLVCWGFFPSRRACHHVKSKRATTYTDSAQRLPPPPPPPRATSCPWAVPNLLPSACRATAAAGSAPRSCSATVGPRYTEPGHPLSRVSPYSRFKKRRAKMTAYSHLAHTPPALTWYLCKSGLANVIFTNGTLHIY